MKTELILQQLEAKHPGEAEYLQAVREVLLSIESIYNQHPEFERVRLIERPIRGLPAQPGGRPPRPKSLTIAADWKDTSGR